MNEIQATVDLRRERDDADVRRAALDLAQHIARVEIGRRWRVHRRRSQTGQRRARRAETARGLGAAIFGTEKIALEVGWQHACRMRRRRRADLTHLLEHRP